MKTLARAILVAGVVGLMASQAHAFRCGNQLVMAGDSITSVIDKCGQPSSSWSNTEFTAADSLNFRPGDGMTYTVRQVNGVVVSISANRG